ncbi:MAG: PadR family transcriptional regulator [Maricaulaceae bacterium]
MSVTENPDALVKPLRRALLPIVLLLALKRANAHGYGLAQSVRAVLGGQVPEGTLYPLLKKLETEGAVRTHWDTAGSGPARKVYSLTPQGAARAETLLQAWRGLGAAVEAVAEEDDRERR